MTGLKKLFSMRKLTSKNLILIICLNVLLPFLSVLIINEIIDFQLKNLFLTSIPEHYQARLIMLILILNGMILAIVDYIFILHPFLHLEDVIHEFGQLAELDINKPFDRRFVKSSLEQNLLDMLNHQKDFYEQTRRAEDQISTTELYALQTQINPHFLYNTLDSIRGLALMHEVTEIASMTEALSRLFRSMIAKEGSMLLLKEEFENVNNYLIIQDFRFRSRFVYECKVAGDLIDTYLIPNMTLQPIVENAIMHGLEKKVGSGKITIDGYVTENRLVLSVTDDGVGIEEEKLNYLNFRMKYSQNTVQPGQANHHMGIALLNINKRIRLRFGEEYGIYLTSTPGIVTTAELVLPAILASEAHYEE